MSFIVIHLIILVRPGRNFSFLSDGTRPAQAGLVSNNLIYFIKQELSE
jgi:hypothetical protein